MKIYEFSDWIESSGGPLVAIEKHLAPLWGGTNGRPSDFDLACNTVNYIELVSTRNVTALVIGDEPLRTLVAHSDDHTLIVRWKWATSEQSALKEIQNIRFPSTYEEHLDIILPSGALTIFDSATHYSETEAISLKIHPGKNTIQTFTYSPNSETSLLIHKISKPSGNLRAVKSNQ
ncbi:Imm21 family immunity protein [Pseudomonas sp. IT-196MI5]|uniref:Imm21 family immunity protein n=1 Tax=Pseudomonas sp. IT-196MI5 TaxID=3026440 RepID=UPI0039E0E79F